MQPLVRLTEEHRHAVEEFRARHKTGVLVLVFTDMVGSTALKQELGDRSGIALVNQHRQVVRDILAGFPEGEEISTAGDSFFIVFLRPSDSVRFALSLHVRLREASTGTPKPLSVRVGIHMGEVFVVEPDGEGEDRRDVFGIQVDAAARVMNLASSGQTLMTRGVFDNARAVLRGEEIPGVSELAWLNHGPYGLKGVDEPFDVCEAGEQQWAPLAPPPDSDKARSLAAWDGGLVSGWRPSPGAEVPTAPGWIVLEKLGEGGFGEVWKAQKRDVTTSTVVRTGLDNVHGLEPGECAAFKFCFDLAHARALRREVTLLKMLEAKQGDLQHTVRLVDYQLESAPLFVVYEYVAGRNLAQWLREEGAGIKPVRRLCMLAPVAQAIGVIHDTGILINDIKPSNILVRYAEDGKRELLIADLGIGQIRDRKFLEDAAVTLTTGFTRTLVPDSGSPSRAGTVLYQAPELQEGREPSVATDAYAFGVTLMQAAVGDSKASVSGPWKGRVRGRVVRRLIGRMVRGDSAKRLTDMRKASWRLRRLPRRSFVGRVANWSFVATVLLLVLTQSYRAFIVTPRMKQRAEAERARVASLGLATDIRSFNEKYPASREAEIAITEAAQIFQALVMPPRPKRASSRRERGGRWPPRSPIWLDPTMAKRVIAKDDDRLQLIADALEWSTGWPLDPECLAETMAENQVLVERLARLPASFPYRGLNWRRSYYEEPPISSQRRLPGDTRRGYDYSRCRNVYRELAPATVWWSLREGDVSTAYDVLVGWGYYVKALKAQAVCLNDLRHSVPCESICVLQGLALVKTYPPERERALRLYDILDPRQGEREFVRGVECGSVLAEGGLLRWAVGGLGSPPTNFVDMAGTPFYFFFVPDRMRQWPRWTIRALDSVLRRAMRAEAWKALAIEYSVLEYAAARIGPGWHEPTFVAQEGRIGRLTKSSFMWRLSSPPHLGLTRSVRTNLSAASVLRAALLLRVEEIDSGGDPAKMPDGLAPLFARQGDPPPRDYLGPEATSVIEYVPDRARGTYLLRYSPESSDKEAFEYVGQWGFPPSAEGTTP